MDESYSSATQIGDRLLGKLNGDGFGFQTSISSSGDIVASSSFGDSGTEEPNSENWGTGLVRIYALNKQNDNYTQLGNDLHGEIWLY